MASRKSELAVDLMPDAALWQAMLSRLRCLQPEHWATGNAPDERRYLKEAYMVALELHTRGQQLQMETAAKERVLDRLHKCSDLVIEGQAKTLGD